MRSLIIIAGAILATLTAASEAAAQIDVRSESLIPKRVAPPRSGPLAMDVDGDGKSDAAEVTNYFWASMRRAQGDMSQKNFIGSPEDWTAAEARFDADHDGKVSKAEMLKQFTAEVAANDLNKDGHLGWDEQAGPLLGKFATSGFMPLDIDGDQKVTVDEMKKVYWRRVIDCDRNGDGKVTRDEWTKGTVNERSGNRFTQDADIFNLLDGDESGVLTRAEVETQITEIFTALDADGNGSLSSKEQAATKVTPGGPFVYHQDGRAIKLRPVG